MRIERARRPASRGAAAWALAVAFAGMAALCGPAWAGLPQAYAPVVVEPRLTEGRTEFDLTALKQRAARENKRLYVYLGASDCPFCRRYEAFLASHAAELAPHFASDYIVADLRSSLRVRVTDLYIRAGDTSLPYTEFQQSIGDERTRQLVYPSVWLFDAALKPLMQMPSGTGTFQTVPEQLEILRLEQ